MASTKLIVFLSMVVVLLPMAAFGDDWFLDKLCDEVECGKGTCKANTSYPFSFMCECEPNWKRTRLDDEEDLKFLPCVIPNCTLDYSCMSAPPPVPDKQLPFNESFFDPCYWAYCGEGTCTKTSSYVHKCECKSGFYNLLNVSAYPCFSECTLGSDCAKLGIKVSNSSSSSPSDSGNQAILPGKFHWLAISTVFMALVLRS